MKVLLAVAVAVVLAFPVSVPAGACPMIFNNGAPSLMAQVWAWFSPTPSIRNGA